MIMTIYYNNIYNTFCVLDHDALGTCRAIVSQQPVLCILYDLLVLQLLNRMGMTLIRS